MFSLITLFCRYITAYFRLPKCIAELEKNIETELRTLECKRAKCDFSLDVTHNGYLIVELLFRDPKNVNLTLESIPKRISLGKNSFHLGFIGKNNMSLRHFTCISVVSNTYLEYDCLSKDVKIVSRSQKITPVLLFFIAS